MSSIIEDLGFDDPENDLSKEKCILSCTFVIELSNYQIIAVCLNSYIGKE